MSSAAEPRVRSKVVVETSLRELIFILIECFFIAKGLFVQRRVLWKTIWRSVWRVNTMMLPRLIRSALRRIVEVWRCGLQYIY